MVQQNTNRVEAKASLLSDVIDSYMKAGAGAQAVAEPVADDDQHEDITADSITPTKLINSTILAARIENVQAAIGRRRTGS